MVSTTSWVITLVFVLVVGAVGFFLADKEKRSKS